MPVKNQKSIEVTAVQNFSYAVRGPKGPDHKIVNVGEHLTITENEAYHWLRKRLIVEGKLKLAKESDKQPKEPDKK